jgi:predicted TIM-barrel fold metal-dependent hydrolase
MALEYNRKHAPPSQPLPPLAADCHMHVFGPFGRYPLAAERAYNVAEAGLQEHERMKRAVGLERTVLVQPGGHGCDNGALLAALEELGARGRGVAVVDPRSPRVELEMLHECGVRGLRCNLATMRFRYGDAAQAFQDCMELAEPLGWHLQLFADPSTLLSLNPLIEKCAIPVVIDHMGLPEAAKGIGQPGFLAVLRLLARGHVWVKLSGADRVTRTTGKLRDAIPFIQALVATAPHRLVWGSDWPNTGFHSGRQVTTDEILPHRELDAGDLLDVLIEAVPDAGARRAILADNPATLYGF